MKKVLILEDEENIRSFVVINLQRAGYAAIEAGAGQEALDRLRENPDVGVAILDIMLPDMDGFEVCRRIRAANKQIGIIMLTARTQEMDKVTGLMTGADDYVTKPFSPAELTARVDALFRRISGDGMAFQEPYAGKGREQSAAHPGGVRHYEAIHAESRTGLVPGGHSALRVGTGLRGRSEDRGREYPPSAHQNRGRRHQSHLYHHGLGLRV